VPALVKVIQEDKASPVRMAAATGLGIMGADAREAVPALRELMKEAKSDDAKRLARAAGEAIRQIEGRMKK